MLGDLFLVRLEFRRVFRKAMDQPAKLFRILLDRLIFRLQRFSPWQEFRILLRNFAILPPVELADVLPNLRDEIAPGSLRFVDPGNQLARHDRRDNTLLKPLHRGFQFLFTVRGGSHKSHSFNRATN